MLEWLVSNAATILISILLLFFLALAVRHLWKTFKSGGCAGCSGCSKQTGCCHCASQMQSAKKRRHSKAAS